MECSTTANALGDALTRDGYETVDTVEAGRSDSSSTPVTFREESRRKGLFASLDRGWPQAQEAAQCDGGDLHVAVAGCVAQAGRREDHSPRTGVNVGHRPREPITV